MALIDCPSCNKRISDKAKSCAHCNYDLVNKRTVDGLSAEKLASQEKLARIKLRYSLQMQAMSGIILFLIGVSLWYFGGKGFKSSADFIELSIAAIGGIWYLTTRVRLVIFKKRK